jgi:hypothetical protein
VGEAVVADAAIDGVAVGLGVAQPDSEIARKSVVAGRTVTYPYILPLPSVPGARATSELSIWVGSILGMTRGASDFRRAEAAWSASRRMIARKERPCYRVADTGDGATVHIIELPWIAPIDATRQTAIDRARDAIAAWLGVQPDSFDLERG